MQNVKKKDDADITAPLVTTTSMLSLNQSVNSSPNNDLELFYQLLIEELHWRDIFACAGTVGANLTQNCYFLMTNAEFFCMEDRACSLSLGITFCLIDLVASGIQNIYQRFWKSVTWAWVSRLPTPTRLFVDSLHQFIQKKMKDKATNSEEITIYIHIDDNTYSLLNPIIEKNVLHTLLTGNISLNLEKALKLIKAYYPVGDIKFFEIGTDAERANDYSTEQYWHFNYNPENPRSLGDISMEIPTLSLERFWRDVFSCRKAYPDFIINDYLPKKIFPTEENIFLFLIKTITHIFIELMRFFLLYSMPLVILVFQTVGMLADIIHTKKNHLALDNPVCLLGILFGYNKWKVNNAMRWNMANKNLQEMSQLSFYISSIKYLGINIDQILSASALLPSCSINAFFIQAGPAFIRLFGILLGLNISLFYLYVALFTKHGIQFTITTGMTDIGFDSDKALEKYANFHPYISISCAFSSLLFNGLLTQMRESIKKCDDLANIFEKWMDNEALEPATSDTPAFVHIANIIDIMVFGLSARGAIQGLLMLAMQDKYPGLKAFAGFLLRNYYAEMAGFFCALSNLIFTYVASAPKQMFAWKHLLTRSDSAAGTSLPDCRSKVVMSGLSKVKMSAFWVTSGDKNAKRGHQHEQTRIKPS